MSVIELKHLRMIQILAETGNMTRAARRLAITQSALSQQLKDIEGKLSADLFLRARKRMIPTAMGRQLLPTAASVIDTVEAAERVIARAVAGEKGTLRIGTQCIFCYKWLPHVMTDFQRRYAGIEVEIGNADDPLRELSSGRFDIIITAVPYRESEAVDVPLFEDQLVCIMPVNHPLSASPYVRLSDFDRYKLISHAENEKNKFYQFVLKPNGIEPVRLMTVGSPHAIVAMVAAGFGLGVFPAWAVQSALAENGIQARPITRGGLPLTWRVVYLRQRQLPAYQEAFVHLLGQMKVADIGALPDCPVAARHPHAAGDGGVLPAAERKGSVEHDPEGR
jgi:LysR family transcriptional regulator for metE and metH